MQDEIAQRKAHRKLSFCQSWIAGGHRQSGQSFEHSGLFRDASFEVFQPSSLICAII